MPDPLQPDHAPNPTDQQTFDVGGALAAGASEDDVLSHLTKTRPYDVNGALAAGASKRQIIDHLATAPASDPGTQEGGASRFTKAALGMMNPVPTLQAMTKDGVATTLGRAIVAQGDQFKKAGDSGRQAWQAAKRGDVLGATDSASEAFGHTVAGAVPLVGPAAANVGEELGTAIGNQMAGVDSDIATPAGKVFGLVAPSLAAGAVTGAGAVADATGLPDATAGALRDSAAKNYTNVLNPTTNANKFTTQRVAPELAQRGTFALSKKGLQSKAFEQVQNVGQQIGDAYANLPAGSSVPLQSVLDSIDTATGDSLTVADANGNQIPMGGVAQQGMNHIQDLKDTLTAVAEKDPNGNLVIPVDKVRKMRQFFDDVAARAGTYNGANLGDYTQASAHAMAADAIREELAKQFPDINTLNKEYKFWKDVHQVVSDTIKRKTGQSAPMGEQLASMAGGAAGFTHAGPKGALFGAEATKYLVKLFRSPSWNTISGGTKAALADMIASGSTNGVVAFARNALQRPGIYRIDQGLADMGINAQAQQPQQQPGRMPPP